MLQKMIIDLDFDSSNIVKVQLLIHNIDRTHVSQTFRDYDQIEKLNLSFRMMGTVRKESMYHDSGGNR